jgi:uncharacterized protein YjbJ (UPF0337 family)
MTRLMIVIALVIESFVAGRFGAILRGSNVARPTSDREVSFPQTGQSGELRRLTTRAAGLWTVIGRTYMSEQRNAEDARKGLIDSIKGRAKEIIGAITKNDSLTAEGQLQQEQARARKEASTAEALADAEAKEARAEVTNAKLDSVDARNRVDARIAATKNVAETERAAQTRAADQAAQRAATRESVQAQADAQREMQHAVAEEHAQVRAADEEVREALDDHRAAVADAAKARAEADDLRAQAEDLPSITDRP